MGTLTKLKLLVGGEERLDYACQQCGNGYDIRHYTCPQCGSYSVERATWPDEV